MGKLYTDFQPSPMADKHQDHSSVVSADSSALICEEQKNSDHPPTPLYSLSPDKLTKIKSDQRNSTPFDDLTLDQLDKYLGSSGVVKGGHIADNLQGASIFSKSPQNTNERSIDTMRNAVKNFDGNEIASLLKQVEEELTSRAEQSNECGDRIDGSVRKIRLLQEQLNAEAHVM